jgi:hypothetical protein
VPDLWLFLLLSVGPLIPQQASEGEALTESGFFSQGFRIMEGDRAFEALWESCEKAPAPTTSSAGASPLQHLHHHANAPNDPNDVHMPVRPTRRAVGGGGDEKDEGDDGDGGLLCCGVARR